MIQVYIVKHLHANTSTTMTFSAIKTKISVPHTHKYQPFRVRNPLTVLFKPLLQIVLTCIDYNIDRFIMHLHIYYIYVVCEVQTAWNRRYFFDLFMRITFYIIGQKMCRIMYYKTHNSIYTAVVLRARLYTFIVTKGRTYTIHIVEIVGFILDRSQNAVDHS